MAGEVEDQAAASKEKKEFTEFTRGDGSKARVPAKKGKGAEASAAPDSKAGLIIVAVGALLVLGAGVVVARKLFARPAAAAAPSGWPS